MVHEIIVQAVRGGTLAVAGRSGKVLCDPPRFITKLVVEPCNSCALSVVRVCFDSQNILTQPGEECRVNLRTDVLSRRIFGDCLKFFFKLGVLARIEFQDDAFAVSQRNFVCCGKGIIIFAERMN